MSTEAVSEKSEPGGARPAYPTFGQAVPVWFKIGMLSFGGPTGQIALMHQELVERHRWISDTRFLHALNYCMLLPGPEAQQLAVYIGWLLHRRLGGIVAGAFFVIPGALLMWGISAIYVMFGKVPLVEAVFYGLKPAVIAIVLGAVLRIGKKALKNKVMWAISALAFIGIYFLKLPFPLILLLAGLAGYVGGKWLPRVFDISAGHAGKHAAAGGPYVIDDEFVGNIGKPTLARTSLDLVAWTAVWLLPVALAWLLLGGNHVLVQEGVFFSKAAMVTFGGAYAVLPYVAQQAVETHGWLTAPQMMDGLGLAETTPGPLILVLQFVGFLGGWNHPGDLPPLVTATLAALISSWVTFVPAFLFIFVGAPYVELSRGNLRLNTILSAITAAVVGVVLNLAVWFGLHVIFPTGAWTSPDWFAILTAAGFFYLMQYRKLDVLPAVGIAALLGLAWSLVQNIW